MDWPQTAVPEEGDVRAGRVDGEGLLDLAGGFVAGVAGLVGVDHTGPGGHEA